MHYERQAHTGGGTENKHVIPLIFTESIKVSGISLCVFLTVAADGYCLTTCENRKCADYENIYWNTSNSNLFLVYQ